MRVWYAMLALLSAECVMSVSLPPLTFDESSITLAFLNALVELRRGRTWHHMYAL